MGFFPIPFNLQLPDGPLSNSLTSPASLRPVSHLELLVDVALLHQRVQHVQHAEHVPDGAVLLQLLQVGQGLVRLTPVLGVCLELPVQSPGGSTWSHGNT